MVFSREHIWLNVEGDVAELGLTQYKKDKMGKIIFLDLPEEGDSVNKEDILFGIEFAKIQSEFTSPLTGIILECNEEVLEEPEALNDDCQANYILKMQISDMDELEDLLTKEDYNEFCSV